MLTFDQVQTAAYITDGGFHCPDCTRRLYGELAVERLDLGLSTDRALIDVSPICRYTLAEYSAEPAYEAAGEYVDYHENPTAFDQYVEDYPAACCEDCGGEL